MRRYTRLCGWTSAVGLIVLTLGARPIFAVPMLAIDSLTEGGTKAAGHLWFARCGVKNVGDQDAAAYKVTFLVESVDSNDVPAGRLLSDQQVVRQRLIPGGRVISRWTGLSDGSFGDPISASPWRPDPGRYFLEVCASLDLGRNNPDSLGTCSREYFSIAPRQQGAGMGQELLGRVLLGR